MMAANRQTGLVCLAAICLPACLAAGAEFDPNFDRAELRGPGGAVYRRIRVDRDVAANDFDGRLTVEGHFVKELARRDGEQPRQIASSDGRELCPLASTDEIAFFAAKENEAAAHLLHPTRGGLRAQIRRLDLESFTWLPSRNIIQPKAPAADAANIDHDRLALLGKVLATAEGVFVLTYDWPDGIRYKPTGYRITCFDARAEQTRWSIWFPWEGRDPAPVMHHKAIRRNDTAPEPLTRMVDIGEEGAVLVCAGKKQDLMCLLIDSGDPWWRIPRIWEYERGYIGPSVGEHYVSRFGIDDMPVDLAGGEAEGNPDHRQEQDKAKALVADARRTFDAAFEGWIAAGPVTLGDDSGQIFVAAARRRKGSAGVGHEQPPHCTVYELNCDIGELEAAVALPRMVDGRPYNIEPGAVVWPCEQGSLARLHFSFPGSGGDAVCSMPWYHEYFMRVPPSWFSASPARGIAAYTSKRLYRPTAAYIEKKSEPIYRFLINVVDLETAGSYDLTLAIPFDGDFPMPEHGYSATPEHLHATQPHMLAITNLSISGGTLRATLGHRPHDARPVAVEFELPNP
ncbi:MAG TPA: hypothetical protein VFW87_00355 [Pirellulales bacterium]|nr:hypothetical protein [Pirellulales bacterium]